MEDKILQNICKLKGVKNACIYLFKGDKQGIVASTFTEEQTNSIINAAEVIEQIISALQAIDKQHDEIYFSLENEYIAAYLMGDRHIAILLTEKRINFPLIHMGIRSACKKMQSLQNEAKQQARKPASIASSSRSSTTVSATSTPTESASPDMAIIYDQLQKLLLGYLGPAAPVVCKDAIQKWQATYVPNRNNLKYLIQIIEEELVDERDQQNFSLNAQTIYK